MLQHWVGDSSEAVEVGKIWLAAAARNSLKVKKSKKKNENLKSLRSSRAQAGNLLLCCAEPLAETQKSEILGSWRTPTPNP